MTRDFKLVLATIIMAVCFGFLLGTITSANQLAHVSEQFAFHVDTHSPGLGRYIVEPLEARIAYTIVPLEGEHPAPFALDSLALCRQYSEDMKLFLRCGMDRYRVVSVGLVPKKQEKKGGDE